MKIDNRPPDPSFTFSRATIPDRIAEDAGDYGPNGERSRALVPTFNTSNLPALLTNTEEQRRERAFEMTRLSLDVRSISPREMSALGLELYVGGHMAWEDYAELAFQPQLHPDYDATIGALEGKHAEPDGPQDYVRVWEERLAFDFRYNRDDAQRIRQTERIVGVMRQLAGSTFFEV